MIGLGAQATWVKINLFSALADCNIVVPTVDELAACTTAQEVPEIQVPNITGLVGFEGSAIFILAPALRNAILASNTQGSFELIPLMSTTARAFDAAHANNGNVKGTATTCSDYFNAWLFGVKEGLINKTRYTVIPEDHDKVAQFYSSHQFQCILNRGLSIGGGMVAIMMQSHYNSPQQSLLKTKPRLNQMTFDAIKFTVSSQRTKARKIKPRRFTLAS
jgi:hypothetical protein